MYIRFLQICKVFFVAKIYSLTDPQPNRNIEIEYLKIFFSKDRRSNSKVFYDDFSPKIHRNVRQNLFSCKYQGRFLIEILPVSVQKGEGLN